MMPNVASPMGATHSRDSGRVPRENPSARRSGCSPLIAVVQASDFRDSDDLVELGSLSGWHCAARGCTQDNPAARYGPWIRTGRAWGLGPLPRAVTTSVVRRCPCLEREAPASR